MLGLKIPLAHAQQVKEYLLKYDLLDKRYRMIRDGTNAVFPVIREFSPPFDFDAEFTEAEAPENESTPSVREALSGVLTPAELARLRTAFDAVGAIGIIDIPPELILKEQIIGETILKRNRNLKTVLAKAGGHEGVYRTQRMRTIAGEDTRETTVIENGVRLKVNVEEAYYSVRMSTERKRILEQIKPGERILCLFSGIGPYPITFAKHTQASTIVGIEINPKAHELALENAALNRAHNVRLLCGDAHEVIEKFVEQGEVFDRITMPLPHTAADFIGDALKVSHVGTIIHYYAFFPDGQLTSVLPQLEELFARNGRKLAHWHITRVGQQAPRIWRICVDAIVG